MATKPYTADVNVAGRTFVCGITLTDEEYAGFVAREPEEVKYVLELLRQNPTYEGLEFDENYISLHPQD